MISDWKNMYLKPNRTQNVMNAFMAVMLIPIILLIFSIASFTQEGLIHDVSVVIYRVLNTIVNYKNVSLYFLL